MSNLLTQRSAFDFHDPPVAVGIAVVEHDERFLVGIRSKNKPLAGFAEFPGGKCDTGELPQSCVVRECIEETGLDVKPVRLLERVTWDYPHGRIELHFWLCRAISPASPSPPFRWVEREELAALCFPEANARVVARLMDAKTAPRCHTPRRTERSEVMVRPARNGECRSQETGMDDGDGQ